MTKNKRRKIVKQPPGWQFNSPKDTDQLIKEFEQKLAVLLLEIQTDQKNLAQKAKETSETNASND